MDFITIEDKILIVLFVVSYIISMAIQTINKDITVKFKDWILGFLSAGVGATITYFSVKNWENFGLKTGLIIFISTFSYATFKFMNSQSQQEDVARRLVSFIKKYLGKENKK